MPDAAAQDSGIFVDAGGLVDAGEDERCTNGLRDIDEEGVDCGGPCASSCSPTACTSTDSAFVPPGYDCVWNEEFGGAVGEGQVRQGLDKQVWIFQNLNVNAEAQNYTNRECSDPEHADDWNYCVEDGALTIRARDDGIDCRDLDDPDNQPDNPDCALDWNESRGFADYTSGRIITKHTVAFQYGYIEFRARLPQFSRQPESGLWPAIWLLGNNISEGPPPGDTPWPGCGEFDIMEWRSPTNNMGWNALWLGADERLTACSSFPRGGEAVCGPCTGGPCRGVEANEERWLWRGWDAFPHGFYHTYGLLWTPEKMEVFIDGLKMSTFRLGPSETEFQQPMFLIVNLAIGGTLGGAIEVSDWSTATLEVDYLRWYR
ncbi:MAG: glycoside hydrolase family 16 protein [Myxococcota bacterium]